MVKSSPNKDLPPKYEWESELKEKRGKHHRERDDSDDEEDLAHSFAKMAFATRPLRLEAGAQPNSEQCVTTMDLDHTPPVMMPAQPPAPKKERRVRQQAKTTREASVPTWGQLKKLATDAWQVVKEQGAQVIVSNTAVNTNMKQIIIVDHEGRTKVWTPREMSDYRLRPTPQAGSRTSLSQSGTLHSLPPTYLLLLTAAMETKTESGTRRNRLQTRPTPVTTPILLAPLQFPGEIPTGTTKLGIRIERHGINRMQAFANQKEHQEMSLGPWNVSDGTTLEDSQASGSLAWGDRPPLASKTRCRAAQKVRVPSIGTSGNLKEQGLVVRRKVLGCNLADLKLTTMFTGSRASQEVEGNRCRDAGVQLGPRPGKPQAEAFPALGTSGEPARIAGNHWGSAPTIRSRDAGWGRAQGRHPGPSPDPERRQKAVATAKAWVPGAGRKLVLDHPQLPSPAGLVPPNCPSLLAILWRPSCVHIGAAIFDDMAAILVKPVKKAAAGSGSPKPINKRPKNWYQHQPALLYSWASSGNFQTQYKEEESDGGETKMAA
ncbi:hypothetical protein QTO34_008003 [Cnephaeus nilssonii]|uniref:Uncharacterized protein n=1 Tax=Cnephaeus nilssonii TaxID=3371016 RepID=A0AA40IAR2_CNENI|nr:hypothetical protein QTO34_008003 [Eptesicus nilssonii]